MRSAAFIIVNACFLPLLSLGRMLKSRRIAFEVCYGTYGDHVAGYSGLGRGWQDMCDKHS